MCTTNKIDSICQLSQLRGSLFACKLVLLHTIMCTIIIQNIVEVRERESFPVRAKCPYGKRLATRFGEERDRRACEEEHERSSECLFRGEIRKEPNPCGLAVEGVLFE